MRDSQLWCATGKHRGGAHMLPAHMGLRKQKLPLAQWLKEALRKQMVHDLGLCYLRGSGQMEKEKETICGEKDGG